MFIFKFSLENICASINNFMFAFDYFKQRRKRSEFGEKSEIILFFKNVFTSAQL